MASRAGRIASRARRLVARMLVVSELVVPVACATNPATGERQLSLISESQEISMGREAAADVDAAMGLYADEDLQQYVDSIGRVLAASSERPGLPWRFRIVDDPVINAFALPGGFIYVARGIMTRFNSEAELASVLGHEIGHVTARHSVEQISRAQLAQIGLVAGVVFVPEIAQYTGILGQGLGLLFLKFGRDDERQSDELGFRYMTNVGYDPRGAVAMFQTLDREQARQGGSPVPDWASTHPNPGDRVAAAQQRIVASGIDSGIERRDTYLSRIDGMVYGPNPRQGFFRQARFLHPELAFQMDFPQGWGNQNLPSAVISVSPNEDAVIQLTVSSETSPEVAANIFFAQEGIRRTGYASRRVNGLPAVVGSFTAQTRDVLLAGHILFIEHRGVTYEVLGYTPDSRLNRYQGTFSDVLGSFRRLTDPEVLNIQPQRIEVVEVPNGMTVERFHRLYPSTAPFETILLLNGLESGAVITRGTPLKRVVGDGVPRD